MNDLQYLAESYARGLAFWRELLNSKRELGVNAEAAAATVRTLWNEVTNINQRLQYDHVGTERDDAFPFQHEVEFLLHEIEEGASA